MASSVNFYSIVGRQGAIYYRWLIWILLFLLFSLVGYYGYTRFFINNKYRYNNVANANMRNPEIVIYLFYADWCPHCTKSRPEWNAFSNEFNGQTVNQYIISCVEIDCSDDADPDAAERMAEFKVSTFPTVLMVKDANTIVYDAKINKKTLESFLISATSD